MGSFNGHAVPGFLFLLLSSWWALNVLFVYAKILRNRSASSDLNLTMRFKSTTWFPIHSRRFSKVPCESIVKFFLSSLGIALELFTDNSWILIKENGEFEETSLNNYAHSAMYGFFIFSALLECLQFWNALVLPKAGEHLALSFAFFVEGLLFYFHLHGRPVLDVRLHTLLYVVVFATSFVLVLEAWMKDSFLLLVVRVYLVMLQGTWFFQIAHSLYGANPWKDTPPNREFVAIAFSWHCLVLLFVWLVAFVLVSVKVRGCHTTPNTSTKLETFEVQKIVAHEAGDSERSSLIVDGEDTES
ncbi:transmembrane protein 45B-like [Actinia tenebrosa]|uniref:Transmembrane protein 45B-like n=1 Tax=Actinia tenebrosa TaxID=6105 RepID=A0A6P8J906_ACTTE|nr:transmembrane protein 45B-like [Actinia tenebrosa]